MARLTPRLPNVGKLGGGIKPGRKAERAGAARQQVMRHRRQGAPIVDHTITAERDPLSRNTEVDQHAYVDIEHNDEGAVTTAANTIPRP
jgi:hypothetical protein